MTSPSCTCCPRILGTLSLSEVYVISHVHTITMETTVSLPFRVPRYHTHPPEWELLRPFDEAGLARDAIEAVLSPCSLFMREDERRCWARLPKKFAHSFVHTSGSISKPLARSTNFSHPDLHTGDWQCESVSTNKRSCFVPSFLRCSESRVIIFHHQSLGIFVPQGRTCAARDKEPENPGIVFVYTGQSTGLQRRFSLHDSGIRGANTKPASAVSHYSGINWGNLLRSVAGGQQPIFPTSHESMSIRSISMHRTLMKTGGWPER